LLSYSSLLELSPVFPGHPSAAAKRQDEGPTRGWERRNRMKIGAADNVVPLLMVHKTA